MNYAMQFTKQLLSFVVKNFITADEANDIAELECSTNNLTERELRLMLYKEVVRYTREQRKAHVDAVDRRAEADVQHSIQKARDDDDGYGMGAKFGTDRSHLDYANSELTKCVHRLRNWEQILDFVVEYFLTTG